MASLTIKELIPLDSTSISGVSLTSTEAGYLDGAIAGTAVADKCVVYNSDKNIYCSNLITTANISLGGSITGEPGNSIGRTAIQGYTFSTSTINSPTINTSITGSAILSAVTATANTIATCNAIIDYVATQATATLDNSALTGNTQVRGVTFYSEDNDAGNTVYFNTHNKAVRTVNGSRTLYLNVPQGPTNLTLRIVNTGTTNTINWTSSASIFWPGGIAPAPSPQSGTTDIYSFYFDGTIFYGVAGHDFG